MKVLVPLADGFEEIEALTIVDVLRRAKIDVTTICIGENPVRGAHDIAVKADKHIDDIPFAEYNFIALPGGMPGSANLRDDERIISLVTDIHSRNGYVSAICAAPIVLARAGLIDGKKATAFPGIEGQLGNIEYIPEPVITDGKIITGKGPGCAIPFALKLVEIIAGEKTSVSIKKDMQVYWM
ncbi:MAG: DJ-1/PfpI family protein [bacterium]|nr:DJ-1/PfpI family protein [bacterium]